MADLGGRPLQIVNGATEKNFDDSPNPTFDDFWTLYPKRVARKDAVKAWGRLSEAQQVEAITAAASWRRVWADKDQQFIPHGATWLNGERFYDELPAGFTGNGSASHMAFGEAETPKPRTAIPDHVRALLAKLRGSKG